MRNYCQLGIGGQSTRRKRKIMDQRKIEIEKLNLKIEDLSDQLIKQGYKIQRLQVGLLDVERKEALLKGAMLKIERNLTE